MRFCRRCLYPENHPLLITFDEDGICSGCRVHEEKDRLDWVEREARLGRILDAYRDRPGRAYDCIVPVSGGRDSFFTLHTLRKVYGLNPLIVAYNRHYNTRAGIWNLERLRTVLKCDILVMTLNPDLIRRVIPATLERCGSFHWHALAGASVFPVQVAVRMNIPLIVWGHHQGLDQVGMVSHRDEVEMTRRYRKEHDLMGVEAEDLVDAGHGRLEADFKPFFYPSDHDLRRVGVRGIYLGNYLRWDSKAQHERMLDLYGYCTAPLARTFDTYNDVDCAYYASVHDWIKVLKWGYGKVTDHACREIRFGRLGREEGAALVRRYQSAEPPADLGRFLDWARLSEAEVREAVDRHRDPRVWSRTSDGAWTSSTHAHRGHEEDPDAAAVRLPLQGACEFRCHRPASLSGDIMATQLLTQGYAEG